MSASGSTPIPRGPRPSEAGVYDALILGDHHTPEDEEAAQRALALAPWARSAALGNREFLRQSVRHMARDGITQFVDMGSGYAASGQVHEVAAEFTDPHVVYVDYNPEVFDYNRHLLKGIGNVAVIAHDIKQPWDIIEHPEVVRLIDFSKPVGVLLYAVIHFILDEDDPYELIAIWREHMAPGSFIAISHATWGDEPERAAASRAAWERTRSQVVLRTPADIERLFAGFDLLPPGVVTTTEWETNQPAPKGQAELLCGLGHVAQ